MNISIRATQENESMKLSTIQKAAFLSLYEKYHDTGSPYLRDKTDISNRLKSDCFRYFTIFLDEEIVGGVLYKCKGSTPFIDNLEEGHYYLQRVYIRPEHQGKKIAQTAILLCEKELSDAKCFFVDFPNDLEKNRRCYEGVGFQDTGKRLLVQPNLILACYKKCLPNK